jgi:hypothetical protein
MTKTIRSLSLTLLIAPFLLVSSSCSRHQRSSDQTQMPLSTIFAGDPNVASQFAKGFYGVEQNAWRWTGKDFAVELAPPLNSSQKGAQLVMKLAVPDVVLQKVNSMQLSASIQGANLEPQLYTKSGQYTFTRDVPAEKLHADVVRIDFSLDHVLPPTGGDVRQLGLIVSEVGLIAK